MMNSYEMSMRKTSIMDGIFFRFLKSMTVFFVHVTMEVNCSLYDVTLHLWLVLCNILYLGSVLSNIQARNAMLQILQ